MNKIKRFLNRFLKFAFLGKIPSTRPIVDIDESFLEPTNQINTNADESSQDQIKNQLIIKINWLLMIVCAVSFGFIIIYPLIYPDKAVPDIIQNAFFTTLGWFGGVLGAFFKVEQNK